MDLIYTYERGGFPPEAFRRETVEESMKILSTSMNTQDFNWYDSETIIGQLYYVTNPNII